MKLQKAAMFGLDARIALAIFGALSVISGAALYSAIQQARSTMHFQNIQELGKALEQYYLDNGKSLPEHTDNQKLKVGYLLQNDESLSTWKGPYISGVFAYNTDAILTYSGGGLNAVNLEIDMRKTTDNQLCATGDDDCYAMIEIHCSTAALVAACANELRSIDSLVDNSDGATTGKVRWHEGSATAHYYRFPLIPIKKQ
tara:strand:+ start:4936 stop:5535 length:600 start_codon:yes stop_codon:yes gene_type:complete